MTFTWPAVLWALAVVPILLWSVVRSERRRRAARAKLADDHLFGHLVPAQPAYRRRLPAALFLVAAIALLLGAARPVARVPLPANRAAVVLAMDASNSMVADDAPPSRLDASKAAAVEFVRRAPGALRIGLVAFSDIGIVLVPPTTNRGPLLEAVDGLRLQQSTSVGSAIVEGLVALPGRQMFLGERLRRLRTPNAPDPLGPPPPQLPGAPQSADDLPPAAIVIFSDGVSNTGIDPNAAVALAVEGRVRVHTVAVGREGGTVMTYRNQTVLVPFDSASLRSLAQRGGGEALTITDTNSLHRIAKEMGRLITWSRERSEITSLFAGVASVLMIAGAAMTLLWARRVP
jgi:Ca-activated chloride channel family protein